MHAILHEVTKITSKGQTTVPKSVRQALGVECGDSLEYWIEEGRVTVVNPKSDDRDPALESFLSLVEKDLANGQNIGLLPPKLASAMRRAMKEVRVDLDETLEGEVCI
jgi:antitoxin PrlF